MARRMTIRGDEAEITVELDEGPVAKELWDRLPMKTNARLRGEEIHFPVLIPAATEAPDRAEVETGDVAYWPPEDALCLFFGDTPARTLVRTAPSRRSAGSWRASRTASSSARTRP
ncbi:MAG: hypothetical protein LC751_16570 [Actinobacteria bacterium]|nr:hypothetical protein [Actinomycetota bacterium]